MHLPVIIKHKDIDELSYINSDSGWIELLDNHKYVLGEDDYAIDCQGQIFLFVRDNDSIKLSNADKTISLSQFIKLVQLHAACSGQCCIDKIGFRSIDEGMSILADLSCS